MRANCGLGALAFDALAVETWQIKISRNDFVDNFVSDLVGYDLVGYEFVAGARRGDVWFSRAAL